VDEEASRCLEYIDPEEMILGWPSKSIRTHVMYGGPFWVNKMDGQQVYFLTH
jgi:hypothetical protein